MRLFLTCGLILGLCLSACSQEGQEGKKETGEKISVASKPVRLEGGVPSKLTIQPLETGPEEKTTLTLTPLPLNKTATAENVPFEPTVVTSGLGVLLLIDASGSMNGLMGTDPKIAIVKDIFHDLTRHWSSPKDPPLQLALRVFGSKYPLEANQCDDSELLAPFGKNSLKVMEEKIAKLEAKGANPLAFALKKAKEDLAGVSDDRVILLLTDGKDTCGEDPCATAKQLYEESKIITHVVAFDIAGEDEGMLKCIAEVSRGRFFLARTKEELASAMDEAAASTIPYNLRLKILVGGTPLPSQITVYKANTQQVVKKEKSFGIELMRLDPSAYDIHVSYEDSIEQTKPSKFLKGVELTKQGKIEQEIRFELASVTLSAHDSSGKPASTEYSFYKEGSQTPSARFQSDGVETTLFLTPGSYTLVAHKNQPAGEEMVLSEKNFALSVQQGALKDFAFQKGALFLKGETSQKMPVVLLYKVTKAGKPDEIVAEGEVEKAGGKIELVPGSYDIQVEGKDESFPSNPRGKVENVGVEGGGVMEKTVTLIVGTLEIKATKAGGEAAPSEITLVEAGKTEALASGRQAVAKVEAKEGKATLLVPPGKYDVKATLISPFYKQGPQAEQKGVAVAQDKTASVQLQYNLGTLKLLGRNVKEQALNTIFYIYNGGTEEIVATAGPQTGWVVFDLNPGNYDIKAEEKREGVPAPAFVWLRDVTVSAGALYVREMVFTNAKLRLIGRGTNNEIIPVEFKLYKYGHDRPLFSGITGQDWQSFDINPDQYYIEASYHDLETSQTLKKWVTLKVEQNEFVEKELRF